jgi:predicted RNA-binding protein Jag
MAAGDLAKLTKTLNDRMVQSSAVYRKEIANKEAHYITIDQKLIEREIRAEMEARGATNSKGELAQSIEDIITAQVPVMCKGIYNDIKSYNSSGLKRTAVSKLIGTPKKFTFVLAQATKGGSTSVFNAFRRIKNKNQRTLIKQIKAQIKKLNSGRTASQIEEPTSNFLDIGHAGGSSIAEQKKKSVEAALFQFGTNLNTEAKKILKTLVSDLGINVTARTGKEPRVLSVSIESSRLNKLKGSREEKQIVVDLNKDLQTLLEALGGEFWLNQESSDSKKQQIVKSILNPFAIIAAKSPFVKTTFRTSKVKKGTSSSKGKKIKPGVRRAKPFIDTGKADTGIAHTDNKRSLFSVIALINKELPSTVRKNMGAPRLENRTGKFAASVKLQDVISTPKGYPSFGYTYEKDPYQVFEVGTGKTPWANSNRDPRKLIDASIREIATQMAIGRFYTRRL